MVNMFFFNSTLEIQHKKICELASKKFTSGNHDSQMGTTNGMVRGGWCESHLCFSLCSCLCTINSKWSTPRRWTPRSLHALLDASAPRRSTPLQPPRHATGRRRRAHPVSGCRALAARGCRVDLILDLDRERRGGGLFGWREARG